MRFEIAIIGIVISVLMTQVTFATFELPSRNLIINATVYIHSISMIRIDLDKWKQEQTDLDKHLKENK